VKREPTEFQKTVARREKEATEAAIAVATALFFGLIGFIGLAALIMYGLSLLLP
jgi:hypothetical protein